jgi:hypothetical protein
MIEEVHPDAEQAVADAFEGVSLGMIDRGVSPEMVVASLVELAYHMLGGFERPGITLVARTNENDELEIMLVHEDEEPDLDA